MALFANTRTIKLNKIQQEAKSAVLRQIEVGEYKTQDLPCLCGKNADKTIAEFDRYGIPLKTVICKKCGLVRSSPYYTSDTIEKFYRDYYRSLYVGSADCTDKKFNQRLKAGEEIVECVRPYVTEFKNKKVFEIGSGAGGILYAFKLAGAECYGCDYGINFVKFSQSKGLTIEIGDFNTLKQYGKADVLILNHVLEHIIEPVEFLKSIQVLLKPESILYVDVPLVESIPTVYGNDIFRYLQNAHVYCFSKKSLLKILKCAGYKIMNTSSVFRWGGGGGMFCSKSERVLQISCA